VAPVTDARIVVMGPSGSGKSVVGARLAAQLALPFIDADDLHPDANIEKMAAGIPLDDADRMPWLDVVAARLDGATAGAVIACSALARRYRDRIRAGAPDALFVELQVPAGELARRMGTREHFMPSSLLTSQLATLEHLAPDERGVAVLNAGPLDDVVARIIASVEVDGA
jgi:gluconokinase